MYNYLCFFSSNGSRFFFADNYSKKMEVLTKVPPQKPLVDLCLECQYWSHGVECIVVTLEHLKCLTIHR